MIGFKEGKEETRTHQIAEIPNIIKQVTQRSDTLQDINPSWVTEFNSLY